MINLYVTIEGVRHEIDTLGDENISITYSIDDIADLSGKDTNYSKDFLVPSTKHNNKIFNHYYDTSRYNTGSFDADKSYPAELHVDGYMILDGFLQLLAINKKGDEYYYKIVIYDNSANLFEVLGDTLLSELETGEILHTRYLQNYNAATGGYSASVDYDNVLNSWTDGIYTDNQDLAGFGFFITSFPNKNTNVLYPLVANSQLMTNPFTNTEYQLFNLDYYENYPISVNLKYITDKIFAFAGFEVNSLFMETDAYKNIYFDLGTGMDTNNFSQEFYHHGSDTSANLDSSPVAISTSSSSITYTPIIDVQNDSNGMNFTTGVYTFSEYSQISVDATFVIQNTTSTYQSVALVGITSGNATAAYNSTSTLGIVLVNAGATIAINITSEFAGVVFDAGSTVEFGLVASASGVNIVDTPTSGNLNATNSITVIENTGSSISDIIANNMPDVKMADVIRDVFKLFNFVVESNENILSIEPYSNYVGTSVVDWSEKIDITNATIKPLKEIRSIKFMFAEDEDDYYLQQYKEVTGKEYGSQEILINPFSKKDEVIQLKVFAPAYVQMHDDVNPIDNLLHIGTWDDTQNGIISFMNKPRLFYKNSTLIDIPDLDPSGTVGGLLFLGQVALPGKHTQTSTAHIYSDHIPNATSNTLILSYGLTENYNGELPEVLSTKTLYNEYYDDYIRERYATDDSYLYEIKVNLKASDIYDWSFQKKIEIKGVHYRINKITYNSDPTMLSRVELYRI